MTCKDCLHFNVCESFGVFMPKEMESTFDQARLDLIKSKWKNCKFRNDKSRFIELPCKVGDSLYLVDFEYGIYKCIVNDIQILSDNEPVYTLYFYSQCGHEPAELEWDIDVESDCFGKTVFLTKKEAEAALEKARLRELN